MRTVITMNRVACLVAVATLCLSFSSYSKQETTAVEARDEHIVSEVDIQDATHEDNDSIDNDSISQKENGDEIDRLIAVSTSTTPTDSSPFDLTTTDGLTYNSCKISDYSRDGIIITHSSGTTRLLWSELPVSFASSNHFCTKDAWARILEAQRRQDIRADAQARISELSAQLRPTFRSERERCSSCNGRGYREARFSRHDGSRARSSCPSCGGSGVETKQVAVYDNAHDVDSIQRQIQDINRGLDSKLARNQGAAIVIDDHYWRFRLEVLASMHTSQFSPVPINTSITVTTADGSSVEGELSRIEPTFVVIDGVMYGRASLSRDDRLRLFAIDWAASQVHGQVAEERRNYNGIVRAMTRARQTAAAEQIPAFEQAICILDEAIDSFPQAFNISQAMVQVGRYREQLAEHKEMTARGYVRYRGRWLTPQQLQEEQQLARRRQQEEQRARQQTAARRRTATSSALCPDCYRTSSEAHSVVRNRERQQEYQFDAMREASLTSGGGMVGPRVNRYRATHCERCNGFRVVQY